MLSFLSPMADVQILAFAKFAQEKKTIATQEDKIPYSHGGDQCHTPETVKLFVPSGRAGGLKCEPPKAVLPVEKA